MFRLRNKRQVAAELIGGSQRNEVYSTRTRKNALPATEG